MTTELSTPSRVIPSKARVAYCSGCEVYVEEAEVGHRCPYKHCNRTLRLRVGYICPECVERTIFFTKAAFLQHRCEHSV